MVRRFIFLFVCFCGVFLLPVSAAPFDSSSEVPDVFGISTDGYQFFPADASDPLEVLVLPEADFKQYNDMAAKAAPSVVIGDTPPSDSPFYGSCWVSGIDSRLGTVTLYFPIDYQSGTFGLTADGYLFNITSSSVSGYLQGVYNNNVSASSFSLPRYRVSSGSSWEYIDLHLVPSDSNMVIAASHSPRYDFYALYPYLLLVLIGGAFLCLWTRSRS